MRVFLLVARSTFTEIWRQPALLILMFLGALGTGGGWWWREFNFGENEARFLLNFGGGMQGLIGALFCIVAVAQTWSREFERRTAVVLRSRSISPFALVAGKSAGIWLVAALFIALSTVWLAFLLIGKANAELWGVFWAETIVRAGKLALITAFTSWFASYGKSATFVILASWAYLLLGNLHGLIDGQQTGGKVLRLLVPDLRWIDVVAPPEHFAQLTQFVGARLLVLGVYTVIFLMLASWSWSRRED